MLEKTVYIRLRNRVLVRPREEVFLKNIAQVIAQDALQEKLEQLMILSNLRSRSKYHYYRCYASNRRNNQIGFNIEVQLLGPSQTIVEVVFKKKKYSFTLFAIAWLLLFFGSMLTIMNFHEDVSMQVVHQKIYRMITGKSEEKPLYFQIPYSIGLGLGMIIFFNHVFKKRLNEEPSPLEVEMFNYQQDLDRYVIMHENKESISKVNEH